MRVRVVYNPRAGIDSRRALSAIRAAHPEWEGGVIRSTEHEGHARELAREAVRDGCELVFAVGGDGTANEVAEGLLGSQTTLGLIPVGSGNGLARTLEIPLKPDRALRCLERESVVRRMDVGLLNERPFLNVAGVGFDAAVGRAFQERGRGGARRGVLAYVVLALRQLFSYRARECTLETDRETLRLRTLLVTFSNGRQYGAGAVIAPRARLDDGRLDLFVVEDAPRLEVLLNAPRLFRGSLHRSPRCRLISTTRAVLVGAGPPHRDGEPEEEVERVEVRLLPRALRVLVPRHLAENPEGPFRSEETPPGWAVECGPTTRSSWSVRVVSGRRQAPPLHDASRPGALLAPLVTASCSVA